MDVQDLCEQIDIAEYIGQYVDLEQRGDELWGISPFTCPPECTPSFSVRPATGQFYDFSSHIGGNVFTFIKTYHKVDAQKAVEIMKKYVGIDADSEISSSTHQRLQATSVYKRFLKHNTPQKQMKVTLLQDNYMNRYEECPEKLQVWRDEGISDETMRFFGVKYDSFSNRIVYPIRNLNGQIVNVGGRTLNPDFKALKLRKYTYFHPWGGRMAIIYGLFENMAAIMERREVILFEGVKSVMLAREFGYKNCAAILTSHLNPEQCKLLVKLGVSCVFALDKEIDIRADRHIEKLRRYAKVEYLYDFENLLDAKEAPVDKGMEVFERLYDTRRRYR